MSKISIEKIGITNTGAEAVVNAANEWLQQGSGVCGVIFKAAGSSRLARACNNIGHCDTGKAVLTPGYNLSKYIIHAVGPRWNGGDRGEAELLYGAYYSSLELCVENDIHSIAFPLISAGIYGYPSDKAWHKALQACNDFIAKNPDFDIDITFAVIDDRILAEGLAEQKLQSIDL